VILYVHAARERGFRGPPMPWPMMRPHRIFSSLRVRTRIYFFNDTYRPRARFSLDEQRRARVPARPLARGSAEMTRFSGRLSPRGSISRPFERRILPPDTAPVIKARISRMMFVMSDNESRAKEAANEIASASRPTHCRFLFIYTRFPLHVVGNAITAFLVAWQIGARSLGLSSPPPTRSPAFMQCF